MPRGFRAKRLRRQQAAKRFIARKNEIYQAHIRALEQFETENIYWGE
jgi:hypothetical protein